MGTIKDRNEIDLTEAEDIKKRWQEYIEELNKIFITQITMMVWSLTRARHPEMWSQLGLRKPTTNKASGGDGIPVELFQILKDDAVKALHSICQQVWKTQQWPQDRKRSVFIPIPKTGNTKDCSNYCIFTLISKASKSMFKILQVRFQ